jgi:NAD(P)-dependent dehydrogenase (short-subunit alcohol dehydrogenase family)
VKDLSGDRRVLVTAGASGLGRAMADAFAAGGARVWIADVDAAGLDAAPQDWGRMKVDVADEAAVAELFAVIEAAWGGLDVLCANAGVAGPTALVEDVSLEDWRACLAVNLDGAFLCAKRAAPMMKRQRSGVITLTSSTAGLYGFPYRSPYAAAKWGVIGLAKTLAMELGPFGVRANAICPGSVEGPRIEGVIAREAAAKGMTPAQVRSGYEAGVALRRFSTAEDVANMAVFLASPAAAMITGQALAVDGFTVNPDPQITPHSQV